VASLNKLGDGSLRSANDVDDANLATAKMIVQSLSPIIPGLLGPAVWLLTSSAAGGASFQRKAATAGNNVGSSMNNNVHCLRDGLPTVKSSRDICVLVAPCNSADYSAAQQLASNGNPVVLVNGLAKDPKSVSGAATMAYFLKPLTYNSCIAGYLIRSYPGPWTVVESVGGSGTTAATAKTIRLQTFTDAEILVPGTNTPDLRAAVRLVQKAVDERAIRARAATRP
jgi:hypothetical protein